MSRPVVVERGAVVDAEALALAAPPAGIEQQEGVPPEALDTLQARWSNESDDPRATDVQRKMVEDVLAEAQLSNELIRDVRCRRSVCRVALDATNPIELMSLAERLREADPPIGYRLEDGEALAYFPREELVE